MTDLSKGIIEINGFEINKDTTPLEVKENLKDYKEERERLCSKTTKQNSLN